MDEICNVYNVFESQYENYLEMVAASNELINNVEQNLYTVNMHFLMIEKIFMNIYMLWEKFLEDSFVLYMTGKSDMQGIIYNRYACPVDKEHAYEILKGTKQYPDWTNLQEVITLAKLYFESSGPYNLLSSMPVEFNEMKTVRNKISHMSIQSERKFNNLVIQKTSNGTIKSAGAFLNQFKENSITYFEYYTTTLFDYVKAIVNTDIE